MGPEDEQTDFGAASGSGSRDIQVGNVFALGSVVLEGLPPVAPTLPLLDRAQIIDGGEPSLFNALS
ncbi:hypothetical protein, partial [Puniceibacterium sediminis]